MSDGCGTRALRHPAARRSGGWPTSTRVRVRATRRRRDGIIADRRRGKDHHAGRSSATASGRGKPYCHFDNKTMAYFMSIGR
jgi:hypothetical protein